MLPLEREKRNVPLETGVPCSHWKRSKVLFIRCWRCLILKYWVGRLPQIFFSFFNLNKVWIKRVTHNTVAANTMSET